MLGGRNLSVPVSNTITNFHQEPVSGQACEKKGKTPLVVLTQPAC